MNKTLVVALFVISLTECVLTYSESTESDEVEIQDIENNISVLYHPRRSQLKSKCQCLNVTTYDIISEIECVCYGKSLLNIPSTLGNNMVERISVIDAGIGIIKKDTFQPYKDTIKDM